MTELSADQLWMHNKRCTFYRIVAVGALMQCSTFQAFEDEVEGKKWVIYRDTIPGQWHHYIRLESEFLDGRFQHVSDR